MQALRDSELTTETSAQIALRQNIFSDLFLDDFLLFSGSIVLSSIFFQKADKPNCTIEPIVSGVPNYGKISMYRVQLRL